METVEEEQIDVSQIPNPYGLSEEALLKKYMFDRQRAQKQSNARAKKPSAGPPGSPATPGPTASGPLPSVRSQPNGGASQSDAASPGAGGNDSVPAPAAAAGGGVGGLARHSSLAPAPPSAQLANGILAPPGMALPPGAVRPQPPPAARRPPPRLPFVRF